MLGRLAENKHLWQIAVDLYKGAIDKLNANGAPNTPYKIKAMCDIHSRLANAYKGIGDPLSALQQYAGMAVLKGGGYVEATKMMTQGSDGRMRVVNNGPT